MRLTSKRNDRAKTVHLGVLTTDLQKDDVDYDDYIRIEKPGDIIKYVTKFTADWGEQAFDLKSEEIVFFSEQHSNDFLREAVRIANRSSEGHFFRLWVESLAEQDTRISIHKTTGKILYKPND